jgi:hypothetical protein
MDQGYWWSGSVVSALSQPGAGFEDLLRGGPRDTAPRPPVPASHYLASTLGRPSGTMDLQQMSDMLDAQFRLREAAQAERAKAVLALIATAEALCASWWDEAKRAGHAPEDWAPEAISAFIVRHAPTAVSCGAAESPSLAAEYERMAHDLTLAHEENGRLRLQLQQTQASAQALAEKATQADRNRCGARQAPPLAPTPAASVETVSADENDPADGKELGAVPAERVDDVIRLIAGTGLSRADEIRERLAAELSVHRGSSRVGLPLKAALHRGLLAAHACVVEWPGERMRQFLVLTPTGRARAVELKTVPVDNEYESGLRLHKTAEHLYLVLRTTDILRAEGYGEVNYLPACMQVGGGEYCPDISAHEGGRQVYVECERSRDKAREAKWSRAAQANGGIIRLVTPNRKIMNSITSEIKATTGSEFKIWAFNISEYAGGARGPDGSIWLHQR